MESTCSACFLADWRPVRPRLGAGPRTAATVGAALWFPAYLIPMVGWVVLGFISAGLGTLLAIWGLVEIVLAALAGAWLYREPVAAAGTATV